METSLLGPLRVRRVVTEDTAGRSHEGASGLTCVLLHGFGAAGDDLVALAREIAAPPGTLFVFPEALHALEDFIMQPAFGDARAWWMIDFARMERAIARGQIRDLSREVPAGLADARAAVLEMLDALEEEQPSRRLVLGGFSQGAMLSLDVALRDASRRLSGLVLLSGTMLAEEQWVPLMPQRRSTPVFQSHGETDAVLPFSIAERLRDAMSGAGLDVTFVPFRGAHTIPPAVLEGLGAWLEEVADV